MHTFWLVLTYDLLEDRCIDDMIIKTFFLYNIMLILYYIKQIDSKLLCVCSVIDHRRCQNMVRTSVKRSAVPRVPLFCSCHILTSSVVYYWTDARKLGIYLLSIFSILFSIHFLRFCKENLSNNPELSLLGDPFLHSCHLNVWFRGDTVTTHWMPVSLWGQRADKCEEYFAQNSPSFFFNNSFIDQL